MTREQLQKRLREIREKGDKIVQAADHEHRELTNRESKELATLLVESEDTEGKLNRLDFNENCERLSRFPNPADVPNEDGEFEEHAGRIVEDRSQWNGWPVEQAHEFFSAVIGQQVNHQVPSSLHPELRETFSRGPAAERHAASGQNTLVTDEGGILVPSTIASEILRKVHTEGQILSRVRSVPITVGNSTKWPAVTEASRAAGSRYGGFRVFRTAEAGSTTGAKVKLEGVSLALLKQTALTYLTEEQIEDGAQMQTLLDQLAPAAFIFETEREIVSGLGAAEFLGILNSAAKITVPKQVGQAADTILFENLVAMEARMHAAGMQNSVILCSQSCLPKLRTIFLPVGTGGVPVWLPATGAAGQPFGTLMGRPLIVSEHCNVVGTEGDLIWFDPGMYLYGFKGRLRMAQSIHVKFIEGETALRFMQRNAGKPWWTTALTPANGGDTVSPILTLETRG